MAKSIQKGKANGLADAPPETGESLDQVRDILFGGQMRMVDARLRGLEERIQQEQSELRNELTRAIAELESTSKKEFANQADRLNAERAKRADDLKSLASELKEALKGLERRHQKLEETAALADADLRDQLIKQSSAISTDVAKLGDRLTNELERTASTLRHDKLDTAAFTVALTEIANRLSANGRSTAKGSSKG